MTFVTKLQTAEVRFPTIAPNLLENRENFPDLARYLSHTASGSGQIFNVYKINIQNLIPHYCQRQMLQSQNQGELP